MDSPIILFSTFQVIVHHLNNTATIIIKTVNFYSIEDLISQPSNHQIILVCYLPRHLSNKKPQVVPVHEFKCIEHEWFTRMQGMLLILKLKKQLFKYIKKCEKTEEEKLLIKRLLLLGPFYGLIAMQLKQKKTSILLPSKYLITYLSANTK